MGHASAFGAAAQREAFDAFFGKLEFCCLQQRRAQIAVVIGFGGDGFLGNDGSPSVNKGRLSLRRQNKLDNRKMHAILQS
jgi:hypothetical protein